MFWDIEILSFPAFWNSILFEPLCELPRKLKEVSLAMKTQSQRVSQLQCFPGCGKGRGGKQ